MAQAMANAPALLRGHLDLSGAPSRGVLSPATRERIALAVAQGNGCSHCLAAHVALNVLTNYFNKAARVALDFPAVAA